jgi:hypothetical protein
VVRRGAGGKGDRGSAGQAAESRGGRASAVFSTAITWRARRRSASRFASAAGSLAPQVLGGRGHPEVVDEAVTGRPAHPHGNGHAHAKGHAAGSQTGV